jgi:hypothetical protein
MKKAFLESKWWFYIPILSHIRISEITEWVMNGEKELDRTYRHYLVLLIILLQSFMTLKLLLIIFY